MKRVVMLAVALMMVLSMGLVSCSKKEEKKTFKIGVIQFGSHPSLDNCYEGLVKGLEASGLDYEIDLQNGNFETDTCDTIAKNMVAKGYDVIVAIATPAAVSAYAASANTNIPVVFCAVSDPVAAGLVDSLDDVGGNCTGTSDVLDLSAQVDLIQKLQPGVKKIGVLYTTSEANSISHLEKLRQIGKERNIEIVEQGVQTAADIPQAAATLAPKVDCINNFTDNNVVNNLSVVLEKANDAGIPVYGSEEEQVVNGCIGSMGLDYIALGEKTGEIVADILKGKKASDIPVASITETKPFLNKKVMDEFDIAVPEEYKDADFVG